MSLERIRPAPTIKLTGTPSSETPAAESHSVKLPDSRAKEIDLLRHITEHFPDFAPAQYALANRLSADGSPEAIPYFQRYSVLVPIDPRPWSTLAYLYTKLNKPAEAELAFKKAIDLSNSYYARYIDLTNFYLEQGRLDNARSFFATALKLAPKLDDAFFELEMDSEFGQKSDEQFVALLQLFPTELSQSRHALRSLANAQHRLKRPCLDVDADGGRDRLGHGVSLLGG